MALPATQRLTLELVPHCTPVTRDGWTGSHDARPLAELGMRQAAALAAAIGTDIDGIYSSPTTRCRQTVGPLAAAAGLPVHDLAELYEADDFGEPAAGTQQVPELMVRALAGTRSTWHPATSPSPRTTRSRSDPAATAETGESSEMGHRAGTADTYLVTRSLVGART